MGTVNEKNDKVKKDRQVEIASLVNEWHSKKGKDRKPFEDKLKALKGDESDYANAYSENNHLPASHAEYSQTFHA